MDKSNAISLLLTIVGVLLGAVIAPFVQHFSERFLARRNLKSGFHSAFVCLISANGIWAIGGALDILLSGPYTRMSSAILFAFAGFMFYVAFSQFRHRAQDERLSHVRTPFLTLIGGNLLWVASEFIDMVIDSAAWMLDAEFSLWEKLPPYLFLAAAIAVFAIGGLRTARKIPRVTPQYGAAQGGESAAASSPPVS